MTMEHFPIGQEMDVAYPNFEVSLTLLSATQLRFEIKEGPLARTETVDIQVVPLGNSIFAVSWQEKDGATVTNVQNYDRGLVHSFATLPSGEFIRMTGPISVTRPAQRVSDDRPQRNKALVIEAMTSLFQRHDVSAVEQHYAADYIQHNPSIPQGRDALQTLVAGLSQDVYYEPGLIVAEGDLVAIHGRIRGWADVPQVVVDLFRIEDGKLAEHWDVLQDEVPVTMALGGVAMFDSDEGLAQSLPTPKSKGRKP
ncbi:nuclear transport factor 2 family protein [Sphingomonas sp. SUN019]|uniref:MoaF-related domain-containing protein n=1 Tax=Sphingomonas sp. SUN019 TaxID=2937788 RepID=UPI0021642773|nr:nuclear transport factor 2 family protein [Sphingomonas sp. SUN019]UVO49932.1 nuclear transport factor 2 family protein [Sphingomonas sp. SUN019]